MRIHAQSVTIKDHVLSMVNVCVTHGMDGTSIQIMLIAANASMNTSLSKESVSAAKILFLIVISVVILKCKIQRTPLFTWVNISRNLIKQSI